MADAEQSTTSSKDYTTNSEWTSVFSTGYTQTSKATKYEDDYRTKCYLQLSSESLTEVFSSASTEKAITSTEATQLRSDDFWELILTDFTEDHAEKVGMNNTLSEAFCWFAMGPSPVQIDLTGHLLTSGDKDYRTKFLYQYVANMRAKQLSQKARTLTLVVKDTVMKLLILSLHFTESKDMPDFSTVNITGVGYNYRTINSTAKLYTGYYGTTEATSSTNIIVGSNAISTASTEQAVQTKKGTYL